MSKKIDGVGVWPPSPLLICFALAPVFARPECRKTSLFKELLSLVMQDNNASGVHLYTLVYFFSALQQIDLNCMIMSYHMLNIYRPGLIHAEYS